MPMCVECGKVQPSSELDSKRCKDRKVCLWRQHKQRVRIAK